MCSSPDGNLLSFSNFLKVIKVKTQLLDTPPPFYLRGGWRGELGRGGGQTTTPANCLGGMRDSFPSRDSNRVCRHGTTATAPTVSPPGCRLGHGLRAYLSLPFTGLRCKRRLSTGFEPRTAELKASTLSAVLPRQHSPDGSLLSFSNLSVMSNATSDHFIVLCLGGTAESALGCQFCGRALKSF